MDNNNLLGIAVILLLLVAFVGFAGMMIADIIEAIQEYKIKQLEYEEKKRIMRNKMKD